MKKKIISFMLILTMVIILSACGNKQNEPKVDEEVANSLGKIISADELLSVYDFNIQDYVTLGEYKNLPLNLENTYDVSEEDVVEYINTTLSYSSSYYEETDKQNVEEGDFVNIDYVGKIDGEEFNGGSDVGAHLEIGSHQFIDGFEEGLVGHKVGENVALTLAFPDDYWNEEFAGKEAVFDVTINSIDTQFALTYESISDEDVKAKFGYDSKQAWYDATLASLNSSAEQQKEFDIQNALLDAIMSNSEVKVPDSLIESELEETARQIELYAKDTLDISVEDYLKDYENCDSMDEFKTKITEELRETLKEQLVVDAIIKKENYSITETGYNDFLAFYLESYGLEEKDFYKRYGSKENVMLIYAENLIITELVDEQIAKIK